MAGEKRLEDMQELEFVKLCRIRFLSNGIQRNTTEAENIIIRFTKLFLSSCRKWIGGISFISR